MNQTLATILGAPVTLACPDGKSYQCKPLSLSVLSQSMERMIEQRIAMAGLPSVAETLRELRGADSKTIETSLRTLAELRNNASQATLDDVLNWMVANVGNMVYAVIQSVIGDAKPSEDETFAALMADIRDGNVFIDRWMEMSFGQNPTLPPREKSSGE